jgi:ATP-dependent Lon protease
MAKNDTQKKMPVVAVRNIVVFPHVITPLFVGREASINAVNFASKNQTQVIVLTQQNNLTDEIDPKNLYSIGTICNIAHISRIASSEEQKVILDPIKKVKVFNVEKDIDARIFFAEYEVMEEEKLISKAKVDLGILRSVLSKTINEFTALNGKLPQEIISLMFQVETIDVFVEIACSIAPVNSVKERQELLEENNLAKKLETLQEIFVREISVLNYENQIQSKIKASLGKYQKEAYLKEQMSVLKKELDSIDENGGSDVEKYEKLLKEKKISKEAEAKIKEEIKKLGTISNFSSEGSIIKAYLDTALNLPWGKFSEEKLDIKNALNVLSSEHYGMDKVKDRILEYICVQKRLEKPKGAILCLHGAPGVGKTSLVKSIAKAMGREYAKISLGGMRDEAEIRGHRKTYIGAFVGKVISAIKKSGTMNPVILLDEIDKISDSYKGDPASALLEVLDPEQNKSFQDNYLEFSFDISNVVFVATANSLNISYPLLDRMDIINLSGYTETEKLQIAEKYISSKAFEATGLKPEEVKIEDGVFLDIIRHYTKEAGVRSLERQISILYRKVLKKVLEGGDDIEKPVVVTRDDLKSYLGIKRYDFEAKNEENIVGVTTGLAYTEAGGDILMIEAVKVAGGKGEVKTTGKLGDVMKESMQAAFSYVQSHAHLYGIEASDLANHTIHIHVPEGATPKDGPSAGITIATSIISLFSNKPVNRDVAMTGEITLRGKVLPIGGLKEKLMSAVRSNIKTVLIPSENARDLDEIPVEIKEKLTIHTVSNASEVMGHAIVGF